MYLMKTSELQGPAQHLNDEKDVPTNHHNIFLWNWIFFINLIFFILKSFYLF